MRISRWRAAVDGAIHQQLGEGQRLHLHLLLHRGEGGGDLALPPQPALNRHRRFRSVVNEFPPRRVVGGVIEGEMGRGRVGGVVIWLGAIELPAALLSGR